MGHELIDDRFRTGQVIGKGNMGEVHRAEDLQEGGPGRSVAVKTILRSRTGALIDTATDTKAVERFLREVRIMRRLEHPNLTRLVAGALQVHTRQLPGRGLLK
ncbi:protein kinase [Streptomyces sp. enrichment culture]|uniref:protein kinase n=1 Tax=Streptomyces sp. enrichment culture TaxID=1795815 RepID=UPI003F54D17A